MKISIFQITKDCNQDCFYCCRDRNTEKINLEKAKKIISSLDKDTEEIIITGGEPTLNKDFFEILKFAKSKIPKVHVQTNGIKFSDIEVCQKTVNAGTDSILIALPSINETVTEKITKTKQILKKKLQGLTNLSRFHSLNVGVIFVPTKLNYKEFPDLVKYISKISRDIYIQVTYPIRFDTLEKYEDDIVKYSEFKEFLDIGLNICKEKNIDFRLDGFPLCFVSSYIESVSDLLTRKYEFVEDFIEHDRKKYDSNNYKGKEHIKIDICSSCKLNKQCKGIYEYYTKIHGTNELNKII